jgi:hypothetical protein
MGKAAREAARTFTMQEWAGRLATLAGPRDYRGQLEQLYLGILDRWRYTMEPGERVPGSADAVLRYTLGAGYNCEDPARCDIHRSAWKHRGWGDCDDVSSLAAAGVLALGMQPAFRVVEWRGGAHVSTIARTPKGELVSIDPVGHPTEQFGWAMAPAGGRVRIFDLDGRPLERQAGPQITKAPGARAMATYLEGLDGYYKSERKRQRIPQRMRTGKFSQFPHVALLTRMAHRGARVLAVPAAVHRQMLLGNVIDGAPAIDQYGQQYEYLAGADVWAPANAYYTPGRTSLGSPMGRSRRARRRAKRRRRFKKFRKFVAKVARKIGRSKIAKFFRKVKAKILGSKLVQGLASKVLSVFGVPPAATKALLAREASIAKQGGRSKMIELAAEGKFKEVGKMIGKSFKAAGKAALPGGMLKGPDEYGRRCRCPGRCRCAGMRGIEPDTEATNPADALIAALTGCGEMGRYHWWPRSEQRSMGAGDEAGAAFEDDDTELIMQQGRGQYPVAYIAGIFPAEHELGEVDVMDVKQTKPAQDSWYQVAKGDTLLEIAGRAYGLGAGGARLKAAQRINASPYNRRFHSPPSSDFGKKYFSSGLVALLPQFPGAEMQRLDVTDGGRGDGGDFPALWIPGMQEDAPQPPLPEPEPAPEPEPDPDPEPPIPVPPEPDPGPEPIDCGARDPQMAPDGEIAGTYVDDGRGGCMLACAAGYRISKDGTQCILEIAPGPSPTPSPEPAPSPVPRDCPPWFIPTPSGQACTPGPCPDGMYWDNAAGPGGIGGCVPKLQPGPVPRPEPRPQPRPEPSPEDPDPPEPEPDEPEPEPEPGPGPAPRPQPRPRPQPEPTDGKSWAPIAISVALAMFSPK